MPRIMNPDLVNLMRYVPFTVTARKMFAVKKIVANYYKKWFTLIINANKDPGSIYFILL